MIVSECLWLHSMFMFVCVCRHFTFLLPHFALVKCKVNNTFSHLIKFKFICFMDHLAMEISQEKIKKSGVQFHCTQGQRDLHIGRG